MRGRYSVNNHTFPDCRHNRGLAADAGRLFLLPRYGLIGTCSGVQNCTFCYSSYCSCRDSVMIIRFTLWYSSNSQHCVERHFVWPAEMGRAKMLTGVAVWYSSRIPLLRYIRYDDCGKCMKNWKRKKNKIRMQNMFSNINERITLCRVFILRAPTALFSVRW
jgi:hypothetical protein